MRQRTTPQLTAIAEVLSAADDHPTAVEIHHRVRRRLPRISLGTVYRNLEKLRAQGRLRVIRLDTGEAHYDAMLEAHDHFVCEQCRAVADLPGTTALPDPHRVPDGGWVARRQTTAVFGLCAACAAAADASGHAPTVERTPR